MSSVLVWVTMAGRLIVGSGQLPDAICEQERVGLLQMLTADRSNFGQRESDPSTWVTRGYCLPADAADPGYHDDPWYWMDRALTRVRGKR